MAVYDKVHVQPRWQQIHLRARVWILMSTYTHTHTCVYTETCGSSGVRVLCCSHSQLSVTIHNSLWRGCSGGGHSWRRATNTGEEVVLSQFEMLWELQLDLGLLDVIVDGRNKGFCYGKETRQRWRQAENKSEKKIGDSRQDKVKNSKIKSVGRGILRYLK